jgi:integrase
MQPAFARHLLDRAFRALGRVRPTGFGFHTLPRKFATDLKDEPIKVVAKLGGWRDLETLLRYQRVTDDDQRATLRARGAPAARPGTADAAV